MPCVIKKIVPVALFFFFMSCGTGPALEEKTGSNASVNVATGSVDVDINSGFTLEFSVAANTASVTSSTFFVVPTIVADTSADIATKAAINTSICDPANALSGSITPSTPGSCVTSYSLTPDSPLGYETEYALCVTSGISFCNPNVNGFFSGMMETFTTVAEGATYTVGGTVTGLSGTVVLQNNAGDDLTLTGDGAFTFSTAITDGAAYDATVKTNPDTQTCTASNNSGTISGANVTNVTVTCSTHTYTVGGSVSGLSGTVVLQNNATDDLSVNANGSFTFPTEVADGSGYAATVKTNPSEQACVVVNDSGTIDGADVTNVSVTCTTNTYSIGGTLTGLDTGSGLEVVLQNNGGDNKTLDANGAFTFSAELEAGDAYAATVSTQPDGQACHVTNGAGTISGDVSNVTVYCAYFAYVANRTDETISVIDTTDNSVYTTITDGLGSGPYGVALTSDGSTAYVTNRSGTTVSVISTASNTVTNTISRGSAPLIQQPIGVDISPDDNTLYFASHDNDLLFVYDISGSPSYTTAVSVGDGPANIAVNPIGTYVYVPTYGANISIVDTSDNTVSKTLAVGTNPHNASFSPNGTHAFISNNGSSNVSVVETAGQTVERTASVGANPQGSAVTPDSAFVYVTNAGPGNLSLINTSTWAVSTISDASFDGPTFVTIDKDGDYAYVSNSGSNTVTIIDMSDNSITGTITVGNGPEGMAIQK